MDSALRPRDIQARIRAGETPETVAQAAQTTVDRIMAYAAPVLAERAHIVQRAQRASLRRKSGEGPARLLEDAVSETLRGHNVDPGTVEWDSWRREDGRWTLVADFNDGERPRRAEFAFDAPGRYVVAEDDDARRLVGELSPRKQGRDSRSTGRTPNQRRLSAVQEDELPLGTDAIELVTGAREPADLGPESLPLDEGATDLSPHERTVDLTQTAREVRQRQDLPEVATGDADWIATQTSERPGTAPASAKESSGAGTGADPDPHEQEPPADQAGGERVDKPVDEASAPEPDESEDAEPAPRKGRKARRASVPSWDEIMFGGGRSD